VRRTLGFALLLVSIQAGLLAARTRGQQNDNSVTAGITQAQLQSTYIHGTIDVVISTREGFVLASDSRATHQDDNGQTSHSDDQQKAFTVGNRAACVVAGLIGSDIGMDGFELRDAIGTHLVSLDRQVSSGNTSISATGIGRFFAFGLQHVAGLIEPTPGPRPGLVGEISAVSILPDGDPDWVTLYLPLSVNSAGSGATYYYTVGTPVYSNHFQNTGLRFGVEAIGMPALVNQLIKANGPLANAFSQSVTMKLFYERKQQGHLDEYSLKEAIELAKGLVAATIAAEPQDGGVGGPIDVLTVTRDGVHWIQRKERSAPFPPPFGNLLVAATLGGSHQPLDGLNFVQPIFNDMDLSFAGNGNVQLLKPTITGSCRLRILPGARRKMPVVVERLKRTLADKCEIKEETDPEPNASNK
jgi:hypothetical protein